MTEHGRLIDADALENILSNAIEMMRIMAKALDSEADPEIQMEIKAYADILNGVKEQPTIEPERKTGEWSVEFSPAYTGGAYCECSQCNYKFAIGAYFEPDEWKFCPYCGADMRGEPDETD